LRRSDRELFALLEPVVSAQGVGLVEVVQAGGDHRTTIRVVIHSASGVTHGDCARVVRAAQDALDDAGAPHGEYDLEVSSPGLRRVLKAPFEFDVFRGLPVRVWVADGETRSEIPGVALGTRDGDRVVLGAEDGSESVIAWSRVTKARLDEKDDLARPPGGKGR
jgi:ribosome maturation factor RimP